MVSQIGMVTWKAEFVVGVDVKVFGICNSCRDEETRKHTTKNTTKKMYDSFRPRFILTPPVSMMSECKDSPLDVQSSLGTTQLHIRLIAVRP